MPQDMIHLRLRSKFCRLHVWRFSRQDWIKPWATWPDALADPVVCWRLDYRLPVIWSYASCLLLSSWIEHLKIRRSHFLQKCTISLQKWNLKTATLPQNLRPLMHELDQKAFCWSTGCEARRKFLWNPSWLSWENSKRDLLFQAFWTVFVKAFYITLAL